MFAVTKKLATFALFRIFFARVPSSNHRNADHENRPLQHSGLLFITHFYFMSQIFIGKLIEEELRRQRQTVVWFAGRLRCNRTNVYKIFGRRSIDTDLLLEISCILRRDFFRVFSDEVAAHIAGPVS